jgi:predicted metal-dependent peptidase
VEKTYLFNPFTLSQESTETLSSEYKRILEQINDEADIPSEIARNIERYANLNIIVGEMIARYKYEVDNLKSELKTKMSESIYFERDDWVNTHSGKAPAMSYFEAKAQRKNQELEREYNLQVQKLTRFKYAYDSGDNKIQALKKKYDAVKHEMGFNT